MTTQTPADDLLTTREAAAMLRLEPQTLQKWSSQNSGPISPIKIARRLRWRRSDIENLINQ